ncbi:MAG: hypothetical protein PHX34_02095 [Candidatus Shapirobacteria bacterium]|nr:hypothetical protein [Candidatus Shapirobacteria bacterium]
MKKKIHFIFNKMKDRKILFFVLLIQVLLILFYIYNSTENIVYQDNLNPINTDLIENFYGKKLTFNNLWKEHNGINIFGSLTITLINIALFKLNTRFEILLSIFSMFIVSLITFEYFRKLVQKFTKNNIIQLLFALIILIYFSLNQWENIVFNGGSIHIMSILPFLLIMIIYDKFIFSGFKKKDFLKYLVVVFFSTIWGGQYTFGLIVSLLITVFLEKVINKNKKISFIKIILLVTIFVVAYFLFYFSIFGSNVAIGNSGIFNLFKDPISSFKFIFLTFSGVLIGVDLFNRLNISVDFGSIIGLVVILIYLYSLIIYYKSKMFKKTIVPLMMIIYSVVTIGIIFISRFKYGINYGLSSRYTTSTMLGLVGCFIILFYFLFRRKTLEKIKIISLKNFSIIVIFLFVISCQIMTITNEWVISPYRKNFYKKLEIMALNLDNYSKDDLSLFQAKNIDYIYNTFAILKKYKLNVFKENGFLSKQKGLIKLSGWNSDGWIGKNAKIMVVDSKEGILSMNLYIPIDIFTNVYKNSIVLQIMDSEKTIGQREFLEGSFDNGPVEVIFDIPKKTELNLDLKLDKSFIPSDYNLGKDSRELGVIINKIEVK